MVVELIAVTVVVVVVVVVVEIVVAVEATVIVVARKTAFMAPFKITHHPDFWQEEPTVTMAELSISWPRFERHTTRI